MNYVGIDLHKKTIVLCVMDQDRKVRKRATLACTNTEAIDQLFGSLAPFRAVVEATASYQWLVELIEPHAEKVVLAHPGKLRVIAESTKKTDRLDAQVLAEFLARDMIPEAYRPTRRQREHRALVRHRQYLKHSLTAAKNKIRRIVADYNADRADLFEEAGWASLKAVAINDSDRWILARLHRQRLQLEAELKRMAAKLKEFAAKAKLKETEARARLATIPGVGVVTVEVVVSELGDVGRFRSTKAVCAYAGLVPAVRRSAGKGPELRITKAGPPLLRWALVEAAWRLIRLQASWRRIYDSIRKRSGGKRAVVAIARRLLTMMAAMLRDGTDYDLHKSAGVSPG